MLGCETTVALKKKQRSNTNLLDKYKLCKYLKGLHKPHITLFGCRNHSSSQKGKSRKPF